MSLHHNKRPIDEYGMPIGVRKGNTSGVTGIDWSKRRNKWRARITINKKTINLGDFKNFDDAVKARKDAERRFFEEYSYTNIIGKEEE